MMTILIGAGVSGFVLGVTSRVVFLLPAALMALLIAGVLIVRGRHQPRLHRTRRFAIEWGFLARRRDGTGDVTFVGLAALEG